MVLRFALLLLPVTLLAVEPSAVEPVAPAPPVLGSIVVVAGPVVDPVLTPRCESPGLLSSTTIIGPARLAVEHAVTVSDALRYVPGAWTETRGRKVKSFVSLRGQTYPYPEYALDGLWQREFDEQPYQLPASEYERIEVVRSAGALLLGLNGLSGVVNLVPRIGERPGIETSVGLDTDGGTSARAGWSWRGEDLETRVSVGTSRTDGEDDRHAAERQLDGSAHLGYAFTPDLTVRAHVFAYTGGRELSRALPPATPALQADRSAYDPQRSLLSFTKLTWRQSPRATLDIGATAAVRNNLYVVEAPTPSSRDERDREFSLNLMQAVDVADANQARVGALYDRVRSPTGKRAYTGRLLDVSTVSVVMADQQQLGTVTIDAAWRWSREYLDQYGAYTIEGSAAGFSKVRAITDTWGPNTHSAAAGVAWQVDRAWTVDGHVAVGLVRPRAGQLTAAGDQPGSERRVNADVGARLDAAPWDLSTSVFLQSRLDAIVLTGATQVIAGETVELYGNRDLAAVGVEAALARQPDAGVTLRLAVSVQDARQRLAGSDDWTRDPERPRMILSGQIGWQADGWRADVLARYLGSYRNDRFTVPAAGPAELGDGLVVDVTGHVDVTAHAAIMLAIENLGDDRYQSVAGYPEAGRRASIGLAMSW